MQRVEAEHHDLLFLQRVTEAYAQIGSMRMKYTREGVLKTRDFMAKVAAIFNDIRVSYQRQVKALMKRRGKKGKTITFLAHNGKTVAAFLGANTGLYGDIVQRSFAEFMKVAAKPEVEVTIVGKMAQSLWLDSGLKRPYSFFILPDYGVEMAQFTALLQHLAQYERVLVFYGRYTNLVRQDPTMFEVTEDTLGLQSSTVEDQARERMQYYFEPSLETLLQFFEGEMFASLLDLVIREGQLSKFASRMLAMDLASQRIGRRLKALQWEALRARHDQDNRKQNSLFSGVHIW